MTSSAQLERCYAEGYEAYFDGKGLSANPYKRSDPDCKNQWKLGWFDACDDDTDDDELYDDDYWW